MIPKPTYGTFERCFIDVISDTITLDIYFGEIISLYLSNPLRRRKFSELLLEKEFFTTFQKGNIFYKICKEKLPHESKELKSKIDRCLYIRDTMAHKKEIEEKWVTTSYKLKDKSGKEETKAIEDMGKEFRRYFMDISRIWIILRQELKCESVIENLTKCVVTTGKTKSGKLAIIQLDFIDSKNKSARLYGLRSGMFNKDDTQLIKDKVKEFIFKKYPKTKEKSFEIIIQELDYPEPDNF